MRDCFTVDEIARYREGDVDSFDDLRRFDSHLDSCERCRAAVLVAGDPRAIARHLMAHTGESACLDFETRARFVDEECDSAERELVRSHTANCAMCAEDLRALRLFREELLGAHAPSSRTSEASAWERLRQTFALPAARWSLSIGGATVGAAIGALLMYLAYPGDSDQVSRLQSEVAAARAERAQARMALAQIEQQQKVLESRLAWADSDRKKLQEQARIAAAKSHELERRIVALSAPDLRTPSPTAVQNGVLVALNDNGSQVVLRKNGALSGLPALPADLRSRAAAALKAGRVFAPKQVAALLGTGGRLMGSAQPGSFSLHSPIATAVSDDRPILRWESLPGAQSYRVMVVDDGEHSDAASGAVSSEGAGTLSWRPDSPLPRGRVYRWFITAKKADAEVQTPTRADAPARFFILDAEQAEKLKRDIAATGPSLLGRGIALVAAGLLDEAEVEFSKLAKMNDNSGLARRLLQSVRSLRRRAPLDP